MMGDVKETDVAALEAQFEADDRVHRPKDEMLALTVPRSWATYTAARMRETVRKAGERVDDDLGEPEGEENDEYRFPQDALVSASATTPKTWRNARTMRAWLNKNEMAHYMPPQDDPDPNYVPHYTGTVQIVPAERGSRLVPRDYLALFYASHELGVEGTSTALSYLKEKECLQLSVTPVGSLSEFYAVLVECFNIAGAGGQVYDTEKGRELLLGKSFCSLTGYGKGSVYITPEIMAEAEESIVMFLPETSGIIVP